MKIVYYKLHSGQEVVATVAGKSAPGGMTLMFPMEVVQIQTGSGDVVTDLIPLALAARFTRCTMAKASIMAVFEPHPTLSDFYKSTVRRLVTEEMRHAGGHGPSGHYSTHCPPADENGNIIVQ